MTDFLLKPRPTSTLRPSKELHLSSQDVPLLKLPPEVRQLVIAHVLYDPRAPPAYPSKRKRMVCKDISYMAWVAKPYSARFETHSPSNCLPLLLTCTLLKQDTNAVLETNKTPDYHLDISILNENDVFPTWTCVPQLTDHLDNLIVDVRLFRRVIHPQTARRLLGYVGHQKYE
ncbi:hypothetical protein BDV19DRAFT_171855 [Aspergillus venezuelensis]